MNGAAHFREAERIITALRKQANNGPLKGSEVDANLKLAGIHAHLARTAIMAEETHYETPVEVVQRTGWLGIFRDGAA